MCGFIFLWQPLAETLWLQPSEQFPIPWLQNQAAAPRTSSSATTDLHQPWHRTHTAHPGQVGEPPHLSARAVWSHLLIYSHCGCLCPLGEHFLQITLMYMQLNAILTCKYLLLYAIYEYCKYIKSGESEKQQNEFETTLIPGIFPALP